MTLNLQQVIICKKGFAEPRDGEDHVKEVVIAFIDGIEATEPCVTIRLNNLKKGENNKCHSSKDYSLFLLKLLIFDFFGSIT